MFLKLLPLLPLCLIGCGEIECDDVERPAARVVLISQTGFIPEGVVVEASLDGVPVECFDDGSGEVFFCGYGISDPLDITVLAPGFQEVSVRVEPEVIDSACDYIDPQKIGVILQAG